jgi:hypothetical protein
MASPRLIERLRAEGVLRPQAVVEEAKRAGLRLPLACALLEKESGGGRNVFGHDPTIFVGAGEVTRAKYREYKKRRVASGNKHMQGVGPCQLTWWEFQDAADREGGCWRPEVNMRVGFRHLVALINQHGEADGARRYNGTRTAAWRPRRTAATCSPRRRSGRRSWPATPSRPPRRARAWCGAATRASSSSRSRSGSLWSTPAAPEGRTWTARADASTARRRRR